MPPVKCRFYARGICKRGSKCRFLHEPEQKRTADPSLLGPTSRLPEIEYALSPFIISTEPPALSVPKNIQLLADATNAIRSSKGLEALSANDDIFTVLETVFKMPTEMLRAAISYMEDNMALSDYSDDDDSYDEYYLRHDSDDDYFPIDPRNLGERRMASLSKYKPPSYAETETVRYQTTVVWSLLDTGVIRNLEFGPKFSIGNEHIAELIKRPSLCAKLERFSAGDSDTGHGVSVTDEYLFILFVNLCKSMRVFHLESFTNLTDRTLLAIFCSCPGIEMVHLSGHDKVNGAVEGSALQALIQNPLCGRNLKMLDLLDQDYRLQKQIKKLSTTRPELWIREGSTLGDGIGANMIAAMTGGEDTRYWLGGKVVEAYNDPGMFVNDRDEILQQMLCDAF